MRYSGEPLPPDALVWTQKALGAIAKLGTQSPMASTYRIEAESRLRLPPAEGGSNYFVYPVTGDEQILDGWWSVGAVSDRVQMLGKVTLAVGRSLMLPSPVSFQAKDQVRLELLKTNTSNGRVLSQLRNPTFKIGIAPERLSETLVVGYEGVRSLVLAGRVLDPRQLEQNSQSPNSKS